ncbi:hypothetical protein GCM10009851_14020 [Herbiconiux moechotypicola]|uniref:Uncharacterized protein n=1 Tax=Herbiconiux moechotypicola TaxID=637393 RepID=A0ABN3DGK3_9MICO
MTRQLNPGPFVDEEMEDVESFTFVLVPREERPGEHWAVFADGSFTAWTPRRS